MSILSKIRELISKPTYTVQQTVSATDEELSIEQYLLSHLLEILNEYLPNSTHKVQAESLSVSNDILIVESRILERTQHPNAVVYAIAFRLTNRHFFPL